MAECIARKWEDGNPICPVCGKDKFKDLDADIWSDWKPDYCPNCGAKMDGGDSLMPNYERMWNSLKRELQQLEEHYSDIRLYYAMKGQPTLAANFKERGDGVAEAILYMDLAEDDAFDE